MKKLDRLAVYSRSCLDVLESISGELAPVMNFDRCEKKKIGTLKISSEEYNLLLDSDHSVGIISDPKEIDRFRILFVDDFKYNEVKRIDIAYSVLTGRNRTMMLLRSEHLASFFGISLFLNAIHSTTFTHREYFLLHSKLSKIPMCLLAIVEFDKSFHDPKNIIIIPPIILDYDENIGTNEALEFADPKTLMNALSKHSGLLFTCLWMNDEMEN